jgi:hypothetical protein
MLVPCLGDQVFQQERDQLGVEAVANQPPLLLDADAGREGEARREAMLFQHFLTRSERRTTVRQNIHR